ncbi:hypothetical protein SAGO17_00106, partial [Mimivirus AB-566-O17]
KRSVKRTSKKAKRSVKRTKPVKPTKPVEDCEKQAIHKVMHEFKYGILSDRQGKQVVNRKQAIAIALSQSKRKCK